MFDKSHMWRKLTFPIETILRSQQIGLIFYASGVAGTLTQLGFEIGKRGLTWVGMSKVSPNALDVVFGRNLARTFARLGPTFIKLGQMMASRPDLVGDAIAEELKILFDRVPPVSFAQIRRILRSELGKEKLKTAFQSIDQRPLASASLSQTHRAVLKDGSPVILKVQKQGVENLVRLDLFLMEGLVRPIHLAYSSLGLMQAFQDFKQATLREIDYREEAKNIDRFQKNYRKLFSRSDIIFPRYFPELTTQRVIVLEPMHGEKFTALKKGSTVARKAAASSLAAVLEQIFDHGFFHADPHAGNLFFLEDEGRVGFIDLGMVGQLELQDKRKFLKVLMAVLQRDKAELAKTLFDLGTPDKKTDFAKFETDINELIDSLKKQGIDRIRIDKLVNQLFALARKNGIYIPNRYALMARSCLMIEGVAKSLDPQLSFLSVAMPVVAKSLVKSYNPLLRFRR